MISLYRNPSINDLEDMPVLPGRAWKSYLPYKSVHKRCLLKTLASKLVIELKRELCLHLMEGTTGTVKSKCMYVGGFVRWGGWA